MCTLWLVLFYYLCKVFAQKGNKNGHLTFEKREQMNEERMKTQTVNRRQAQQEVLCKMSPWQRCVKRSVDVACSSVGLVCLSPLLLVVSVGLLIQRNGSVFFSQERIGRGGRPFYIYKFRTMRPDAEADGPKLAEENDSRLTRLGAFLRRHHLDELPQLWNVLKGDMSMVGYRPERQYFIERIMQHDGRYACLFQMRPGVTSEATLYNGYTDTMDKMLERLSMDLHYVETATPARDFGIMFRTFGAMLWGKVDKKK